MMTTKPITASILPLCCLTLALYGGDAEAQEASPALDNGIDVVLKGYEGCVRESNPLLQPLRDVDLGVNKMLDHLSGGSMRMPPERLARAWFSAFREPRYGRIVEEVQRTVTDEGEWERRLREAKRDIAYVDGLIGIKNEIALVQRLDAGLGAAEREGECGRVLAELLARVAEQRDRARSWLRFVRFHVRKEKGLRVSEERRRQADEAEERLRESENALRKYRQ